MLFGETKMIDLHPNAVWDQSYLRPPMSQTPTPSNPIIPTQSCGDTPTPPTPPTPPYSPHHIYGGSSGINSTTNGRWEASTMIIDGKPRP